MKIAIVGGGASGLMAAYQAAAAGAEVVILERNKEVGKKILATGNGRCNLTNTSMPVHAYRGEYPDFARPALMHFSVEDTMNFFEHHGLLLKDKHGYIYPRSGQAVSVRDFFLARCKEAGVTIEYEWSVCTARKNEQGFTVTSIEHKTLTCDKLILAGGGKAAPKTGSDGSLYEIAKEFGHTILEPLPALTGIHTEKKSANFLKKATGVRCDGLISICCDGKEVASDFGELQLTDYGISGIPAFQVSRYAAEALYCKNRADVILDFLPDISDEKLEAFFRQKQKSAPNCTLETWLSGMLHTKLIAGILSYIGIPGWLYLSKVKNSEKEALFAALRQLTFKVTGTEGFEKAQVTAGGVDTSEVSADTMESKCVPDLYFCGELLDIDGACGGYNLQWAWSSGFVAGRSAAGAETSVEINENPLSGANHAYLQD